MKVILFNAPPRAGKDIAVDYLYNHITLYYNIITYNLFDYALVEHIKLAKTLKDGVHMLLGLGHLKTDYYEAAKDTPSNAFMGATPRQAYINCAESFLKPMFGDDIFGNIFVNQLKKLQALETHKNEIIVLCSDLGFESEAKPIIKYVGADNILLLKLMRNGCDYNNDSRRDISLKGVTTIGYHNNGTKDDLYHWLKTVTDEWFDSFYGEKTT